jgi:hypothetical protein
VPDAVVGDEVATGAEGRVGGSLEIKGEVRVARD